MAHETRTTPREGGVLEFLNAVEPARRRDQGLELLDLFTEVTGVEPAMWGPTIVGYGRLRYTYATGHSGEMMRVGFSPRKAALTLYGMTLYGSNADLLDRLGPHTTGKGCVYVKRLSAVDQRVLRELVERSWGADA